MPGAAVINLRANRATFSSEFVASPGTHPPIMKVKGFHSKDRDSDKDPDKPSKAIEAIVNFIEDNFLPAKEFADSTLQLTTQSLRIKLQRQYGKEFSFSDILKMMTDLGFIQINMPGSGINPVWLLKAKQV